MAWLKAVRRKNGHWFFWIHDRRDGRMISIPAGERQREAELKLEQYVIRRDLEKEGYDDGLGREAQK